MAATIEAPASKLGLRVLADIYESTLKVRNAAGNRIGAAERGADDTPTAPSDIADNPLMARLEQALDEARLQMEEAAAEHPVFPWLMGVPGLNKTMACRVLGMIPMETEEDFATFSRLRTFAGLCPGRNRLKKGEKACFCRRLKTSLYVAYTILLKAKPATVGKDWAPAAFYADIYEKWRIKYAEREGVGASGKAWLTNRGIYGPERFPGYKNKTDKKADWPDGRQSNAAKNKLLDVLLVHLWRKWREAEGWSVRSLYVHDQLGHHMDYAADDFSSPAMAKRKGVR